MAGRTRKVYVLRTRQSQKSYDQRHELYGAGARWHRSWKQWWSPTARPIKLAVDLLGGDAKLAMREVKKLPEVSENFQGGKPRRPRKHRVPQVSPVAEIPLQVGQPFVRDGGVSDRRQEDRRSKGERRGEGRPEKVLVMPVNV